MTKYKYVWKEMRTHKNYNHSFQIVTVQVKDTEAQSNKQVKM